MAMVVRLGVVAAFCAVEFAQGVVRADHDHGEVPRASDGDHPFGASLGLVAASYETMLFAGDYEAVVPGVRWSGRSFAAGAQVGLYRLVENGRTVYGAGDVVANGQATVVRFARGAAGAALAVSIPTGDRASGLGMGHPMVMPSAWGSLAVDRVTLGGSAGYALGIGGSGHHADHGAWPLVDPMSPSELIAGATATVALAPALRAGAGASGAIPTGDGNARLIAGIRGAWTAGRVETTFELQAGLAGDPFTLRGILATSLNF